MTTAGCIVAASRQTTERISPSNTIIVISFHYRCDEKRINVFVILLILGHLHCLLSDLVERGLLAQFLSDGVQYLSGDLYRL